MTVLERIIERKKERLSSAKGRLPLATLKTLIQDVERPVDFQGAIRRSDGDIRLIAEIKKASPSKGLIRSNFDHRAIAAVYREHKVNAISVLTEEDFFQGKLDYLPDVKKTAGLPVLRKDFIIDEYQIYEARANHADAILLIAAILDLNQADEYLNIAAKLGLAAIFEVHDHTELEMALEVNAPIIGINNRNLKTLQIDLNTTISLKKNIPQGIIVVSESGISMRSDVVKIAATGIDAMLVGTCFMQSSDIGGKISELWGQEG